MVFSLRAVAVAAASVAGSRAERAKTWPVQIQYFLSHGATLLVSDRQGRYIFLFFHQHWPWSSKNVRKLHFPQQRTFQFPFLPGGQAVTTSEERIFSDDVLVVRINAPLPVRARWLP